MTVEELEKKVWNQDGVRIVVRDRSISKVKEYPQTRAAREKWSVKRFLDNRIKPLVRNREVVVLDGNGIVPNGRTHLKTIRLSYN